MAAELSERGASRALNRHFAQGLLRHLAPHHAQGQRFDTGRVLCRAGQPARRLPYVIEGRLHAVLSLGTPGALVIPIDFEAGEVAMLSGLFTSEPLHAGLVAACPTQVLWLTASAIEEVLLQDQALLLQLVRFLAQRLREVQSRERAWLERGVHERVCATLARLAMAGPRIAVTHEQLAMRCGVSRPKLSNELKRLERAGHLRLHRGAIELLQPTLPAPDSRVD